MEKRKYVSTKISSLKQCNCKISVLYHVLEGELTIKLAENVRHSLRNEGTCPVNIKVFHLQTTLGKIQEA